MIELECRDELANHLKTKRVETLIHYPTPPHLQECYEYLDDMSLPVSEHLASSCLSLQIHSYMEAEKVEYVCHCVINFFEEVV